MSVKVLLVEDEKSIAEGIIYKLIYTSNGI